MEEKAVYLRKSRADQGTLEETLCKHKKRCWKSRQRMGAGGS